MKAGQNARDDPFITLTFCTKSGEPTQKPVDLVFTQQHGEQRDRECNEWVRKCIEHIVIARKEKGSANKRAQKTETGMRPLVRRWVAPEMIRPHTSGDAPPPEPEDFIIAPELLEAEPEMGGWDEFSGTPSEEVEDDTIVPQPEEYLQADGPRDESAEVFFPHEESPIEHAPEPLPDPIPSQREDEPAPDVPESVSLETDARPAYHSGADSTQSPEPELVPETEIPEVVPDTQPEIPEKVLSSSVPAEQVFTAEPDTAAAPDEGKFSSVLKKLAIASGWTPPAEPDREPIPAVESTSTAGSFPAEITPVDEIALAAEEYAHDDHLHISDKYLPPAETRDTGEQQTPMPDTPDTAKPDEEPVRSDATPETVVPLEFPNESTPRIPEMLTPVSDAEPVDDQDQLPSQEDTVTPLAVSSEQPAAQEDGDAIPEDVVETVLLQDMGVFDTTAPDDRRDGPAMDEPSLPREPEDILPRVNGTPARSESPEPPRRRLTFPTGMALLFVALLLIAVTAILLTTPIINGGVKVNEPPVIVTPSPAPITTITTRVTIPSIGTWIRVTYNGTFVGSIGNPYSLQPISGTGDQIYSSQTTGDIIQVSVQKQDYYGDMLNVQIYTNGTAITQQSTRVPHGAIDLLIDTRTGNPPGVRVHT